MAYHSGELAVQSRAGVRIMADRIGRGIRDFLPPLAVDLLQEQPFAVLSAADAKGQVWAAALVGTYEAVDLQHLRLNNALLPHDPLYDHINTGSAVGLIFIDFATRQRMRINGTVVGREGSDFEIEILQAYTNCAKHIHPREQEAQASLRQPQVLYGENLSDAQWLWIQKADTLFIATLHADSADASHRGGDAGFVRVVSSQRLQFPDYAGNMMFNTLGNITEHPAAGLLLLDFEQGRTLQLTGQATILWDDAALADFPGAERVIQFDIAAVLERANDLPVGWKDI